MGDVMADTCRYCQREVATVCQRPSCRVRRAYAERPTSLLPLEPLDMSESELPEPTITREIDGVTYDITFSAELYRRAECPGLSSWNGREVSTVQATREHSTSGVSSLIGIRVSRVTRANNASE
jgi:hypothetical protein